MKKGIKAQYTHKGIAYWGCPSGILTVNTKTGDENVESVVGLDFRVPRSGLCRQRGIR